MKREGTKIQDQREEQKPNDQMTVAKSRWHEQHVQTLSCEPSSRIQRPMKWEHRCASVPRKEAAYFLNKAAGPWRCLALSSCFTVSLSRTLFLSHGVFVSHSLPVSRRLCLALSSCLTAFLSQTLFLSHGVFVRSHSHILRRTKPECRCSSCIMYMHLQKA